MVFLCALAVGSIAAGQSGPSLAEIQPRAEAGDVEAQNTLGNFLTQAQRYPEALAWYQKAAAKGFAPAQFNVGLAFELGRGVPVDERAAFRQYLLAAERGFTAAQFNVGNMYAQGRGVGPDLFEASIWFKQAAEAGLAEAQYNLAVAYEAGRGLRKDEAQAARWYKAAAEQGFVRAIYNLGLLFEDGRGVAKDEAAAARLYGAAAERGYAPAQNNLGLMHATGRGGLPADLVTAYAWLSLAVEGGASPQGRDFVLGNLPADVLPRAQSAAAQLRARLQSGTTAPAREVATASPEKPATPAAAVADAPAADRVPRQELERAVAANNRLAEANQRLASEKAQLELDKADLEKWAASLEKSLNERARLPAQLEALRTELASVQQRLQQSEANSARLAADLAAVRSQTAVTGTSELRSLQDEVVRLRRLAGEASSLRAINDRLSSEVERLRGSATTSTQLDALNLQLAAAQTSEREARRKLSDLQDQFAVLRGENEKSAAAVTALQRELGEARTAAQSSGAATAELAQLRQSVQDLTEQNAKLAAAAARDDAPLLAARRQIDDLQGQLAVADSDRASIREDALKLRDEFRRTRDALATAETRLADLQREVARGQNAGPASPADEAALVAARGEAGRLQAELDTAREALRTRADEIAALRTQLAQPAVRADSEPEPQRQLAAARTAAQAAQETAERAATELSSTRQTLQQRDARLAQLTRELAAARSGQGEQVANLEHRLAEANRAIEKQNASVAELTADHDRLERELAAARQDAAQIGSLRAQVQQLLQENNRLGSGSGDKRALENARTQIAALENELAQARTKTSAPATVDRAGEAKLRGELGEAASANEKLRTQVAELTAANAKLEQDFANARKTAEAALAAQAQAVTAAQPDAYQMEIRTLQDRLKQLESAVEDDRAAAAREIGTLAEQLTKARETSRALADANRALLAAKQADDTPSRSEFDQLQARVRDLTAAGNELRRQNERLVADRTQLESEREKLQQQLAEAENAEGSHNTNVAELTETNAKLEQERDALRTQLAAVNRQLASAQQTATTAGAKLVEENRALDERLQEVGARLVTAQQQIEQLQREQSAAAHAATESRTGAEKAQAELAALKARLGDVEKITEAQGSSVAELTAENEKLTGERDALQQQLASVQTEAARALQAQKGAEQLRTDAERSAAQNIDALTAQLAQLRREVDGLRASNQSLSDSNRSLDRERQLAVAQLRQENAALSARLAQAQGTLDQIAAAARLGTPASGIASTAQPLGTFIGNATPASPAGVASEPRVHVVTDGDSLSRLSLRYYGTASRWQEIFNANREVLQGANSLRVGQRLRIP